MSVGTKLGRYELLARIATGGMGEIFLARMEGAAGFEKLCVVKRILPHLADDGRFRAMLIGEARIASSMSHANICHVYALEETNHQLYMVMEYLEGATLLQLLRGVARRRQKLSYGFIAGVIQQACEGLHYAHELRDRSGNPLDVVHRDVTPSNLFLTESGVVKLVDFGIAKVKDAANTETGEVKGKYAYMAPEQLRSQSIDRRVDVFSLAVVAFEMITCRRLFQRKTDYLTFRALLESPVIDVREHRPDAPEAVSGVLQRALDPDPEARYPTVRELGAELLAALAVSRPWTQGDISELVRAEFAADISLHNAEISKVLKRPERDPSRAIPLIARPRSDSDGPDYFSSETDPAGRSARNSEVSMLAKQSGLRPAAFGHSQTILAVAQASLPLPQAPSAAAPRRSRLLPVVAILGGAAAVLAAGLFAIDRALGHTAASLRPAAAPVTEPPAPAAIRPERFHRPPSEPYGSAIDAHEQELDQCARDHDEALPSDAKAVLVVGVDGHVRKLALEPASTEKSPLGGCIRRVLQLVAFPASHDEKQVALGLALQR
jgi:serine/threonine-protein kinase